MGASIKHFFSESPQSTWCRHLKGALLTAPRVPSLWVALIFTPEMVFWCDPTCRLTAEGAYRLRNASQNVNLVFFQLLGCTNQLHHHKKHTKNAFASTFCWWRLVITIAFTSMSSICNMFTGDNFKFKHLTWTWKFNEDDQFDLDLDNWKIHLISLWWFWHWIRKMNIFLEDSFKYKHLTWKLQ